MFAAMTPENWIVTGLILAALSLGILIGRLWPRPGDDHGPP